ncbi:MAG TPA: hypothetical protein VFE57_05240 [Cyclobacteriaceae bacterium]|nr:hypothetical protein [Cyclobacteriaceae bacterium]
MSKRKKSIEEFFISYEDQFNTAIVSERIDEDQIRKSYADCFIGSSHVGVQCGKNDDKFFQEIQQRFDFYRSIGSKGMNIVSKEITLLDDFHALVKVYWRHTYEKEQRSGAIDFDVFYLVSTVSDEIKIIAFLVGDEQRALKEAGLTQEAEPVLSN